MSGPAEDIFSRDVALHRTAAELKEAERILLVRLLIMRDAVASILEYGARCNPAYRIGSGARCDLARHVAAVDREIKRRDAAQEALGEAEA